MRRVGVTLAMAAFVGWGQTGSFDIATFTAPAGWSRTEGQGNLMFQGRRMAGFREQLCQIYLFPSRASQADAGQNFASEWQNRVAGTLKIAARPLLQTDPPSDGWTMVTGHVDAAIGGAPMRMILATATGFGKTMSVLALMTPNSFQTEVAQFFQSLRLNPGAGMSAAAGPGATVPETTIAGAAGAGSGQLGEIGFTAPNGWTRQGSGGRVVLVSPMFSGGERCQITILPMRAGTRPLADDAVATFRDAFKANPLETYPSPPPRLAEGMSPAGWEYFTIRKLVGGQEGDGKGMGTILLLAKAGNQVATVIGTSKDFMVSNCFGELVRDLWPSFFYSLQFQGARPGDGLEAAMKQRMAGEWIAATGSVGLHYTFKANGRYASAGARRQVTAVLPNNEVLETTTAYFGDGSYSFNGNTLVLTKDDQSRKSFSFRLERVSKDAGRNWSEQLCLLDPGASGEVCYRKQ